MSKKRTPSKILEVGDRIAWNGANLQPWLEGEDWSQFVPGKVGNEKHMEIRMADNQKGLLYMPSAEKRLGRKRRAIVKLCEEGKLRYVLVNDRYAFEPEWLEAFVGGLPVTKESPPDVVRIKAEKTA